MADNFQQPIVIRRSRKGHGGHHGGAWKIAYADFVTAMMAFFLLMWLLGSTTKGQLEGIAEYFKDPLKISTSDKASSADSIIDGGGQDLTRQSKQVKTGDTTEQIKELKQDPVKEQEENERLKALKQKFEHAIENTPSLKRYKSQILLDITSEGLRVQIVDEKNRPMFAIGRAELQPYTKEILMEISKLLNGVPNKIGLSGHTDSTPYAGGNVGYSNWELSADRANASRRTLVAGGVSEGKLLRVVGLSSALLLDRKNPANPMNRRISIVIMNDKAVRMTTSDGPSMDIGGANDVQKAVLDAPRR